MILIVFVDDRIHSTWFGQTLQLIYMWKWRNSSQWEVPKGKDL